MELIPVYSRDLADGEIAKLTIEHSEESTAVFSNREMLWNIGTRQLSEVDPRVSRIFGDPLEQSIQVDDIILHWNIEGRVK